MVRQLVLPDGLTVFSLNPDETRFVHREVFGNRCYLKHGIELHEGDCVFDVGANIGLSALFFHQQCPRVHIYAFEPGPTTFECLKANIELHRIDADLFDCGLASKSGVAEFSFYPGNTVMSGFYADLNTDRGISKTYMINSGLSPQNAERMLGFLFKKLVIPCRLRTLSEIVDEKHVARIDLLKVDVEKSERDVLGGIRDEHWGLIRQIAIEVHDEAGSLDDIRGLLKIHDFSMVIEQDPLLTGTSLFNLFAIRG